MSEPTYTLREAQSVLARRECARHGHDLNELKTSSGLTRVVFCERCAARFIPDHTCDERCDHLGEWLGGGAR